MATSGKRKKILIGSGVALAGFALSTGAVLIGGNSSAPATASSPRLLERASQGTYAGVYPNADAAEAACQQGVQQGRWHKCVLKNDSGQVELWVA
jgi:hypothetical protein